MNRFILLSLLGLIALDASATQIDKKNNWALEELASGNTTVCIASTMDRGILRDYSLQVQKVKNSPTSPVEIFLIEKGKNDYGPLATAKIGTEVLLLNQSSIEAKSQSFWYLPDETKALLDLLKTEGNALAVTPFANLNGRDLKFALKGAAYILAEMEKNCNQGKELVDARFSSLTNHPASFDLNPKVLDANTLSAVRAKYYSLASTYNQLLVQEAQLEKLVEANKPALTEREILRAEKTELANNKIPALKQDIQATTLRIAQAENRLVQLKTEIPAADKARALAQSRYDAALKAIQPHVGKHNQLSDDLENAEDSLSSAMSEISSSNSEIASNTRQISQLDSKAQQLTSVIQRLRSEVPSAEYKANRREQEYNAYNADYEIRRKLDQSSRYQSLKQQTQRLHEQIRRERETLRDLEQRLNTTRAQLQQCQAVAGSDCTALTAQLNQQAAAFNTKKGEVQNLERDLNYAQREMDGIENDIEREVRSVQEDLRRAMEQAENRLNSLNSQIAQAEGERRDIMEYQIPRLRNRNDELRNIVADLERRVPGLQQEVRVARSALNAFDQSVGYAKLEQTLNTADDQLDSAKNTLNTLIAEQNRLNTQVPSDKARLANLNDTLKSSEARLVAVNQRLVQLDSALASFDSAKKAIDDQVAAIKNQLRDLQGQYLVYFK